MSTLVTSTARVRVESPARSARSLVTHFSASTEAEWDPDHLRGHIVFARGEGGAPQGTCDLLCGEGVLMLSIEGPAGELEDLEDWVEAELGASPRWARTAGL